MERFKRLICFTLALVVTAALLPVITPPALAAAVVITDETDLRDKINAAGASPAEFVINSSITLTNDITINENTTLTVRDGGILGNYYYISGAFTLENNGKTTQTANTPPSAPAVELKVSGAGSVKITNPDKAVPNSQGIFNVAGAVDLNFDGSSTVDIKSYAVTLASNADVTVKGFHSDNGIVEVNKMTIGNNAKLMINSGATVKLLDLSSATPCSITNNGTLTIGGKLESSAGATVGGKVRYVINYSVKGSVNGNLTYTNSSDLTASGTGIVLAASGSSIVFNSVPEGTNVRKEWRDNGEVVNGTNANYTINNIKAAHTVTVEFDTAPEQPKYTVSYNANGGSGSVPTDPAQHTSGAPVTVLFDPLPTRSGYTFLGWATSPNAITPAYYNTSTGPKTFNISGTTTLHAVWFAPVTGIVLNGNNHTKNPGQDLLLNTIIEPSHATNKNIVWSVVSHGNTGASISGNLMSTTASTGTARIKATIADGALTNGAMPLRPYEVEFDITLSAGSVTNLGNQNIPLETPIAGNTAQTALSGTGFTGAVTWINITDGNINHTGIFGIGKQYQANVTLTSTTGYQWPNNPPPNITVTDQTVQGLSVTGTGTGNQLKFSVTFAAAEQPPAFSAVTVTPGSHIFPYKNAGYNNTDSNMSQTFTLKNTGTTPLSWWSVTLSNTTHFEISAALSATTNIAPNATATVTVRPKAGLALRPSEPYTSKLIISYEGGTNLEVALSFTVTDLVPHTLTVKAGDGGTVVNVSGDYIKDTVIAISAAPNPGYKFNGWTTSNNGTFANKDNAVTTFKMPDNATTITANFVRTGALYGDLNKDDKVDGADLILMLRYFARPGIYIDPLAADVNGDGRVNMADLIWFLRYFAQPGIVLGPKS